MSKKNITISVDVETHESFQRQVGNVSEALNQYMGSFVHNNSVDKEKIDIQIEKIEVAKLEKQMSDLQAQYKARVLKIQQAEEMEQELHKRELERQKEEMDKKVKCHNCGHVYGLEYNWNSFGHKQICKACYGAASANQIKEWMK